MTEAAQPDELDRLRAELASLNDQVKLLVRTEQRLHRSQSDLDRQLGRIEALAEFSFRCSGDVEPESILDESIRLLSDVFDITGAAAVLLGSDGQIDDVRGFPDRPSAELASSTVDVLETTRAVRVLDLGTDDPVPKRLRQLVDTDGTRDGEAALLSLRSSDGALRGGIAVWRLGEGGSFYVDRIAGPHDAFLYTVASYAERALQAADLRTDLRTRGHELSEANDQLGQSLGRLEATQADLIEAKKLEAVGRLAGGVAHDFNNLLTIILGHVQLMHEELPAAPESETLENIIQAVNRASEITEQLLAFGRQQPRQAEVVDANEAVVDILRVLDPLLGDDVSVSIASDPAQKWVRVDRTQLGQIVLNLALNARDAMPSGGHLDVVTRPATSFDLAKAALEMEEGAFVAISITDNGAGMDDETAAQLFEPFFTTKEVGKGSGLGLASTYGLVRQNGGHITVETELGVGSTFTILFPRTAEPSLGDRPGRRTGTLGASILVVEDNAPIRSLTAKVLVQAGFAVRSAADGVEALEVVDDGFDPTLVVTDVMMPNMGGGELIERLRSRHPRLPVVYISGHPFESLDLPDPDDAITRYLAKPFTPAQLRDSVQVLLAPTGDSSAARSKG